LTQGECFKKVINETASRLHAGLKKGTEGGREFSCSNETGTGRRSRDALHKDGSGGVVAQQKNGKVPKTS